MSLRQRLVLIAVGVGCALYLVKLSSRYLDASPFDRFLQLPGLLVFTFMSANALLTAIPFSSSRARLASRILTLSLGMGALAFLAAWSRVAYGWP